MKNSKNTGQPENSSPLAVSVTVDEAQLLKCLVEKLASRRGDTGYSNEAMPAGWEAVETSSIEAFVSGNMDVIGEEDHLSMSYITCFVFTCTKLPGGENYLSWVNSLS
jgi:hypothetical protein